MNILFVSSGFQLCAYLRDIPKMYFKNIFTTGIAYYKAYAIGFMTKYVLKNVKVVSIQPLFWRFEI